MSECDGAAETLDVAPVPEPEGDVECLAVEVLPEAQLGVRATSSCGRLTGVRRVSCLAPAGRSVVPWRRAGLPTAMRPLRSAGSFRPLRL